MKKTIRIIIPIILAAAIIACVGWYLFIYDVAFTRDMLLKTARHFESKGNHKTSAWFYNCAYRQTGDSDAIAIELANQYKNIDNYTKAELTLSKAIADGGGKDVYIALCQTLVEQDKLMDAVKMLNDITNKDVKAEIDALRPAAPTCSPDPTSTGGYFTQYITVTISANKGKLYVSNDGEFPSIHEDAYKDGITLKDGRNLIYAVAVSENGLVSPTATFGFTVGGVIERITFEDTAMEAAIRELLEVNADKVLYTDDLWKIKEFTVPDGASNYKDLRHMAYLEKLSITAGKSGELSNIAGLENLKELQIVKTSVLPEELNIIGGMPNLVKLTLNDCGLSTIAGLKTAVKLTYLELNNNPFGNLTPLSGLTQLTELKLSNAGLTDLSALSSLSALTALDISHNEIVNLSAISTLDKLQKLTAEYNKITEIAGLENLKLLTELNLSYNSITNVSSLASCTELKELNISYNNLTDISNLSALVKLLTLNFSNNNVGRLPEFPKDCALVTIDGSTNKLDTLVPLGGLLNLNNVLMDYNSGITSLKALADCPRLILVNVFGTGVRNTSVLTGNNSNILVNYDPTK